MAWAAGATALAISARCRFIASLLQAGRIRAAPLPSLGQTAPKNDEDSVRGPHQGQQSTRTAPTGRERSIMDVFPPLVLDVTSTPSILYQGFLEPCRRIVIHGQA